jgi:hypothetical protein
MTEDQSVDEPTGEGVDRSLIREYLALTPIERLTRLTAEARFVRLLDASRAAVRRQTVAQLRGQER